MTKRSWQCFIPARRLVLALGPFVVGCTTTIQSGSAGVASPLFGTSYELAEGIDWILPLTRTVTYSSREQQKSELLSAIASDGGGIQVGDSLVTYQIAKNELVELDREVGPDYYEVLIRPEVQSAVRRVFAGLRSDQLSSEAIRKAQDQITVHAATALRPYHIILQEVVLRRVASTMPQMNRAVTDTGVAEQAALSAPSLLQIARANAKVREQQALGIKHEHEDVAPTLTATVLNESAVRAWEALLIAPNSSVTVVNEGHVLAGGQKP